MGTFAAGHMLDPATGRPVAGQVVRVVRYADDVPLTTVVTGALGGYGRFEVEGEDGVSLVAGSSRVDLVSMELQMAGLDLTDLVARTNAVENRVAALEADSGTSGPGVDIKVGGTQPASGWWLDTGTPEPDPLDIPVTATGPTWTDDTVNGGGTWTTPTETGITYSPASGTATPGQTVTVTATAQPGYVLQGTTSWQHTFPAAANLGPVAIANGYADSFDDEAGATPTGWSAQWNQAPITSWMENAGGFLRITRTTTVSRAAFRLDDMGVSVGNVDILCRLRTPTGLGADRNLHGVVAGASGAVSAEDCFALGLSTNGGAASVVLSRFDAGVWTPTYATSAWTQGAWVNLRVNIAGTSVKARAWDAAGTEPATWQVDATVPATKVGWVGLHAIATDSPLDVDYFAAVTTGTAPVN